MFTLDDLQRMSGADELSRDDLVQINTVKVEQSLPAAERIENYLSQIKNPYHFLHNGLMVHLSFEKDGADLKSCMASYFQNLKKV